MNILRTFEVNGRDLKVSYNEPETDTAAAAGETAAPAPGTGNFEIGPLQLSTDNIVPGESLSISAQIRGENIAFIFTEILFEDQELAQFYGPMVQEYVLYPNSAEAQALDHPVWDAEINLELNITPTLRVLSDGVDSAFAFMSPIRYNQQGYQLDGLLKREGSDSLHRAVLKFDHAGQMTGMLAFKENGRLLLPRALSLKTGDQFSPCVQVIKGPNPGSPAWQIASGTSTTLTRQATAFHWISEPPAPGSYRVGLVIQDLDGNLTRQYIPFTIRAA